MKIEAITRKLIQPMLFLVVLLSGSVLAQDEEAIGTILMTKGDVAAITMDGDTRLLRRRSEVFASETIVTGEAGFAQIRLVDSAIIALKEDTEFQFNEYSFDGEGGESDRAIMSLVRGGFRTIDGFISDDENSEYRVDTQYASIGVRGTTHEAVIDQALGALFTGVANGGTTVSNGQGAINLGVGGNFDFSRTELGQAPQGLNQIPAQLGNIAIAQNPNLENEEEGEEDGAQVAQGDDNDGGDVAGGDDEGDEEVAQALADISEEIANNASLGSNSNGNADNAPGLVVALAATTGNPSNSDDAGTDTSATAGNSSTNVQVQINPANNARSLNALAGNNNAGGNDNGNSGNNNGNGNSGGNDTAGNGNSGNNNGNSGGNDTAGNGNSGNNNGNSGGNDTAGNGNSGNNNGNSGGSDTAGNGNSGNNNGNGNNGGTDTAGTDTGNTGNGNSGNNNGNGNNSGTDTAGTDTGNTGNGNSGNNNSNGGGNNGNNVTTSTNQVPSNPDLTIEECIADANCTLVDETSNGNGNNNGNGNGNSNNLEQDSSVQIRNLITGISEDINNAAGAVTVSEVGDTTVLFAAVPADAEGGVESSGRVGDLTVDWGYWSLPGLLEGSQEISSADFQRVYLAVVDPANMDDLKSVSGNWSYSSVPNQFTGAGTAGTLTGLEMGFDVDLNSGAISNGNFDATVGYGAEQWSMNFTGSVNGASAAMDNFSNDVVISPNGITQGIEGSLGGVFTGAGDTNGFVTGFSLTNGASALGGLGLLEGTPE